MAASIGVRLARRVLAWLERLPATRSAFLEIQKDMFAREVRRIRNEAGTTALRAGNGEIMSGLFQGVRLRPIQSWGADLYSVFTGQYERELQPIVANALKRAYACYIDIGCANGLYAVGLAVKAPESVVIAYDLDPRAREVTRMNAELNDVADRVDIRSEADGPGLTGVIGQYGEAFVICDIEGAEIALIDPLTCPALRDTDLLIELHGDIPELVALFTERFRGSHRCLSIERSPRSPFSDALLDFRWEDEMWVSVSEGRENNRNGWIFLERLTG